MVENVGRELELEPKCNGLERQYGSEFHEDTAPQRDVAERYKTFHKFKLRRYQRHSRARAVPPVPMEWQRIRELL